VRVHELSRELGVSSKDILESLEAMGYEGRTASSTVPDEAVPRIRAAGGHVRPGSKPRAATEEQLPRRRSDAREGPVDIAAVEAEAPAPEAGNGQVAATVVPEAEVEVGPGAPAEPSATRPIRVARGATPQDLADRLGSSPPDIVKILFGAGEMVSVTQSLSDAAIELVAAELGRDVDIVAAQDEADEEAADEVVDASRLVSRAPVVTVMGHVDHGKTLLLDAIRETDVAAGEFGGITQHIGAYQVRQGDRIITFIDTPGHEAFTAMRARGAEATDVVVLVVAADDGVMPQTIEALNHAKAAGVPIVVAVNKIDKDEADPQRVRQQLTQQGIVPVEWGGEYEFVDVSAKAHTNLDNLLETLGLVADLQELKADPSAPARGVTIEAHLDRGRGPIATMLVQRGTLRVGDAVVCGGAFARVRAMYDENMQPVQEAGPSKPVQVIGWSHVPEAGDDFRVVSDEREARHIAQEREARARAADLAASRTGASLADLLMRAREGELPTLNLIVKADVQGSLEALVDALDKLPQSEVRVNVLHRGVGGITENDVSLAAASEAIIIGFNVRPEPNARDLADKEGVDLRLYRVIYQALDEIRQALSGLLAPEEIEVDLGRAEVRALFRTPRGVVAGCMVVDGQIARNSLARLVRDGAIVWSGRIGSLRRFKEDVREVAEGFECGIGLENFHDIHEGDVIETYEVRETARTLA
jgi:translation initiation factor IF-2